MTIALKTTTLAALAALSLAALAVADDTSGGTMAPKAMPAARSHAPAGEPERPRSLAIGAAASLLDVKMTSVDGKELSIDDAKGAKGTLVVFECNGCPFVKAWQDRIVKIGNGAAAQGIGMIAIDSNDPSIVPGDGIDGMKQLASAKGYRFPYVADHGSKVARAFGAGHTPEAFLLDASGKVVYHGAIDDNGEDASAVKLPHLANALTALSTGQEIQVKETKAIGCSIKYPTQG